MFRGALRLPGVAGGAFSAGRWAESWLVHQVRADRSGVPRRLERPLRLGRPAGRGLEKVRPLRCCGEGPAGIARPQVAAHAEIWTAL